MKESGVGSAVSFSEAANWILKKADNTLGGAFGAGYETKIQNALTYISNNYKEGDAFTFLDLVVEELSLEAYAD